MKLSSLEVQLADVKDAAERIAEHVLRTPLVPSELLSAQLGCEVWFKAENLQHIGAFKARGATNAVLSMDAASARRGVVTHSSGNHAAALARAASRRGIEAHVVMPENSAVNKVAVVRRYGVEPVFCAPNSEARAAAARELQDRTGATLVHPYDDPWIMAGQGTVGLEILEQCPDVEVVLVPVGGGGLLSGVLTAVKSLQPKVEVIAVEPAWANDAARSWRSGHIESPTRYDTIADGLRTSLGQQTFPVMQALLDDIVEVDEASIVDAVRAMLEEVGLVAEPSGAVTLAALQTQRVRYHGRRVVAVVSGGNLDLNAWSFSEHSAE